MYSSVVEVHASCAGSDEAWDHVWEKFAGQLGSYSMSENFELLTIVVRLLYAFKMSEDMEAVNETITYRLSNCERHMLLSKRDLLQILKEEAEKSGYNDHVDNQG